MKNSAVFLGFAPWIVFAVVAAIKFTLWYPDHADGARHHGGRHDRGDRQASAPPPQASG